MSIKIEINKNIVLLHALLNRFDQLPTEAPFTPLRKEMIEFFKDYKGEAPDPEKYRHYTKGMAWLLMVSEVPEFKEKVKEEERSEQREWDFRQGSYLKPFLLDFYNDTEFVEYYRKILPKLKEIAGDFEKHFKSKDIEKVLEETWGSPLRNQMIVIPNPFGQGSFGPQIGDINYQVIGMWKGKDLSNIVHSLVHEGSHPITKEVQKPYLELIDTKEHLLEKALAHPNYDKNYNQWRTCFEEHLIRAVQRGLIAPKLGEKRPIQEGLDFELENNGMVFIEQFYDVLKDAESVSEAIPKIVERLE